MMNFIVTADWQTHHLMLFSVANIRFDLHFVIWMSLICFFLLWSDNKKEKLIAISLAGCQFLILIAAGLLDYIDYLNVGSGSYDEFITGVTQEQERSSGVRPDALMFATVDFISMLILIKLNQRPRRMIDTISLVFLCLIFLHLVIATFNFESAGAMMAYDLIWIMLYYAVFTLLFLTSGKAEKAIGHIRAFDYSHILLGIQRA